jgi:hypothetical protein
MGPFSAFESYFQDMLAVFASVRSIFVRRFLLGPALKLLAVLVVVLLKGECLPCWPSATWPAACLAWWSTSP